MIADLSDRAVQQAIECRLFRESEEAWYKAQRTQHVLDWHDYHLEQAKRHEKSKGELVRYHRAEAARLMARLQGEGYEHQQSR